MNGTVGVPHSSKVNGWQARWAKGAAGRRLKNILAPDFKPPAGPLLLQLGVDHAVTLVGR